MRETRTIGKEFTAEVKVYNKAKWERDSYEMGRAVIKGIVSWEIVTGEDAREIEARIPEKAWDEMHEYLILNTDDNGRSIFFNSRVDMFRV